eukprot:TRINITY_DN8696_c0_g2_i1.p1 TRINITY_DN8696_c0_g2~~TRINITY_DN8696_c0_g2_i1.p1  ORF type:complete len:405 (+),score=81.78 TRINITY_DN8696_c0_g2_i1:24-1217(+)
MRTATRLLLAGTGVASMLLGNDGNFDFYPTLKCPEPKPIADGTAGPPSPGFMQGYWLTEAAEKDNAVCIDGTPAVYYHRPGTGSGANKWYIHHQGGGWCNTPGGCWERSNTPLGSSLNYTKNVTLEGGYFDTSPGSNPQMYNWNVAFLNYCDGGSFSGLNSTSVVVRNKTLWFRGFAVLNAVIDDLFLRHNLSMAEEAVISGCSAGALATYLHSDHWANRIRKESPKALVHALPDSGFFPDYNGPPAYEDRVKGIFSFMNITSGLHPGCVAQHPPEDAWKCFFAENTIAHTQTPTFAMQSEFDEWQIVSDLGTNDTAAVNAWGDKVVRLLQDNMLSQQRHGVFLDSCYHHCDFWGNIVIDGDNIATAFQQWYYGNSTKRFWFQNQTYPCPTCCKPPH